jgi:hypothetical protein
VREDRVDRTGKVSLRYDSRLYKIGLGRAYKGRQIKLLIADRNIRVIDANGELIRELTLDPSRNYQPLSQGLMSPMSCDITSAGGGTRTPDTRIMIGAPDLRFGSVEPIHLLLCDLDESHIC